MATKKAPPAKKATVSAAVKKKAATPVKKAPTTAAAKKAAAPARARPARGARYTCEVCGLAVTVDEVCGCVDACDILCCGEAMKPARARASRK